MIETQTNTKICAHCGLPAIGNTEPAYCCNGCRVAYELIHGWGLDDYYSLRDQVTGGADGQLSVSSDRADDSRHEAFNDDTFLGPSAPTELPSGLLSAELAIYGLHCAACAWLIENAASRTPGWKSARVKMSSHTIVILFDPESVKLSQIAALLGRLGYQLTPLTDRSDQHVQQQNRQLLIQIAIAGFCAANAMWIAIALYAGDASGVLADHRNYLRWFGTALGLVAVCFPGRTFFTGALASLKTRTPHMDLPVALGLSVGTIVGTFHAIAGSGDVYFDSLAVLVFFLLIGRWIQFRQQHRAAKSVDLLLRITPRHARLKIGPNQFSLVLADSLQPGDVVRVAAGDSLPVDGIIKSGKSLIDLSLLTGESQPVPATVGDEVCAGTVNIRESIDVSVAAVGQNSRMGRVMKTVEEAAAERTPIVQLADRVGGIFVVVVTLLAAGTFVFWASTSWTAAASNATALLIVACPCALALATPLAIAVALGRAAKQRILIRDGGVFQYLAKPGRIWFDKTGTLTEGRITAGHVVGSVDAIRLAAAIERELCHPIADAIERCAIEIEPGNSREVLPAPATPTQVATGGVTGHCEGKQIWVGNLSFMRSENIHIDEWFVDSINGVVASGQSPILIAIDGNVETVLQIFDPTKPNVSKMICKLKDIGWEIGMLSGDHPAAVARVADEVGIEPEHAMGGLTPEEKLETVRCYPGQTTVMVGDGANDAAALAAADVGIAVRGGAEVSLQAAPVFISSGDLGSICELMAGSRHTMQLIAVAFSVSLGYNMIAVALAMTGRITPLVAAILMPISSVTVLALTLAWPTFGGKPE